MMKRDDIITWMTSGDAANVDWKDCEYWNKQGLDDDSIMELDELCQKMITQLQKEHGELTDDDVENGVSFSEKLDAMVDDYIVKYDNAVEG